MQGDRHAEHEENGEHTRRARCEETGEGPGRTRSSARHARPYHGPRSRWDVVGTHGFARDRDTVQRMTRRVFITGVAGFLGSHLAERLLALGHTVSGCDNLSGGVRELSLIHI